MSECKTRFGRQGGGGSGDVTTAQFNAHVNDVTKHVYIEHVETDAQALAIVPSASSPDLIFVEQTGRYYQKNQLNTGYTQNAAGGGGSQNLTEGAAIRFIGSSINLNIGSLPALP